ncbi:GPI inositol deacylase [Podochytrium sp. JEL0797]|nr:GPI inositol deacylase [Podochytrium sp. JEL0797]
MACRMTYMYPGYERVPVPNSPLTKYGLYLYQEAYGRKDSEVQVPVLFIPGNAGAFKQARSIGTVGNLYANEKFGIRVFSVDNIEELAAFDSQLIKEQARFVNDAIRTILDSYTGAYRPRSVVILAHSMGGVVAKSLFGMDNYVDGSVENVITLATPHLDPPIAVERGMVALYEELEGYWVGQFGGGDGERHPDFKRLMVISVAGGERDVMIRSGDCEIGNVVPEEHGFTVYSTGVKDTWVSADHLCILWCNQLTHVIARGIYGMIDRGNAERTIGLDQRVAMWRELMVYDFGSGKSLELGGIVGLMFVCEVTFLTSLF